MSKLTIQELESALIEALENAIDEGELGDMQFRIFTFEEEGILANHGIVLKIGSEEFQISIVRSK